MAVKGLQYIGATERMLVISQIAISGPTATGPTNDLYGPELQHGSSWRDGQFGPPMTTGICPPCAAVVCPTVCVADKWIYLVAYSPYSASLSHSQPGLLRVSTAGKSRIF